MEESFSDFSEARPDDDRVAIFYDHLPRFNYQPKFHGSAIGMLTGDRMLYGTHALLLERYARILRDVGCVPVARFWAGWDAVLGHAESGKPTIGICNGFQILCESGLLPGVLTRNDSLQFRCQDVFLRTEASDTAFTRLLEPGQVITVPISHGEGSYYADEATVDELEASGRVAFRYCDADGAPAPESNPNGSVRNLAGIVNERGNVPGMMPPPEPAGGPPLAGGDGR